MITVEVGDYVLGSAYRLVEAALPIGVDVVTREKTKWDCSKTPTIRYRKNKLTGGYELIGLNDAMKPNLSGLTLKFNAKKSTFKGSFKVYATNEDSIEQGRKPTLKKYTFTVSGEIDGNIGTGTTTCRALRATWPIVIE